MNLLTHRRLITLTSLCLIACFAIALSCAHEDTNIQNSSNMASFVCLQLVAFVIGLCISKAVVSSRLISIAINSDNCCCVAFLACSEYTMSVRATKVIMIRANVIINFGMV